MFAADAQLFARGALVAPQAPAASTRERRLNCILTDSRPGAYLLAPSLGVWALGSGEGTGQTTREWPRPIIQGPSVEGRQAGRQAAAPRTDQGKPRMLYLHCCIIPKSRPNLIIHNGIIHILFREQSNPPHAILPPTTHSLPTTLPTIRANASCHE